MVMGTWSEPVEGREVSQRWQKEASLEDAKDKSITEGREDPPKGKRVKTPGKLSYSKPFSEALEK